MPKLQKYLLECLGTFLLVFILCAAVILNQLPNSRLTSAEIAVLFGTSIALLIFALGKATGAHLNPAVTLCFAIEGSFPWGQCLYYWLAQFTGALAASALLRVLFPHSENLGAALQLKDDAPAFLQETWLSLLFLVASFSFRRDTRQNRIRSAVVTGAIAFFAAWIYGPAGGTGMNPARALAPALLSGETTGLWIFLLAPVCGAFAAAGLQGIYDMARSSKTAR